MAQPKAGPRVGLYIHSPYCETKCGYCDFYSVPLKDREPTSLVAATCRELTLRMAQAEGVSVATVFLGGGTPTVLTPDHLKPLLEAVARVAAPVERLAEYTVEANPGTVDDAKAALLRSHGVDRVSMGAQSFSPAELAVLERLHDPADIEAAVTVLRRHGFTRINLDLIFGIPGQSLASWRDSLQQAVDLGIEHLSCYSLMYEPGTRLTAQKRAGSVVACDESLEADMFELTVEMLAEAGFAQYEISNFTKPGQQCLHNLIYWRNEPYIGVGPSAAGCFGGERYKNVASLGQYVERLAGDGCEPVTGTVLPDPLSRVEAEREAITSSVLMHEMVLMQLRLVEGLSLAAFAERTGANALTVFAPALAGMTEQGLIEVTAKAIRLTRRGMLLADAVMTEFALALPGEGRGGSLPILGSA